MRHIFTSAIYILTEHCWFAGLSSLDIMNVPLSLLFVRSSLILPIHPEVLIPELIARLSVTFRITRLCSVAPDPIWRSSGVRCLLRRHSVLSRGVFVHVAVGM